jgi:hypothetical protein
MNLTPWFDFCLCRDVYLSSVERTIFLRDHSCSEVIELQNWYLLVIDGNSDSRRGSPGVAL